MYFLVGDSDNTFHAAEFVVILYVHMFVFMYYVCNMCMCTYNKYDSKG